MTEQSRDGQPSVQSCSSTAQPLFALGRLLATPGALVVMEEFDVQPMSLVFDRHVLGDFGDLCAEDRQSNFDAILLQSRIFSSYKLTKTENGRVLTESIWIITESDRSCTTLLRPCEY